jgi:LysM repeat protein
MSWSEIEGEQGLKDIFEEEFIDRLAKHHEITAEKKEEYFRLYEGLVITESRGKTKAYSSAGAAGMHQIIKETANILGLEVGKNYDERYGPLESCRACAKYLYGLVREFENLNKISPESKDPYIIDTIDNIIKLAIHAYNGLVGKYKTLVNNKIKKGIYEEFSLKGYYKWAEGRMNLIRDSILNKANLLGHRVRKGDNLSKIAKHYGLNKQDLKNLNKERIKNLDDLKVGQTIHLPANNEVKAVYFKNKISSFIENLNYLPSVEGAADALKEKEKEGKLKGAEKKLYVEGHKKIREDDLLRKNIIIKLEKNQEPKELISKYSLFNIKEDSLMNELSKNKLLLHKNGKYYVNVRAKRFLRIPAVYAPSLEDLAEGDKQTLERLIYMNPSVRNFKLPVAELATLNSVTVRM